MSYTFEYINPLIQFEKLNVELILVDDEGILPPVRQWMTFSNKISENDLIKAGDSFIVNFLVRQSEITVQADKKIQAGLALKTIVNAALVKGDITQEHIALAGTDKIWQS